MTLAEAKKQVDHTLAALFYGHMKSIKAENGDAQTIYKNTIAETGQLLQHMSSRIDILFGHDTEALALFLAEAGVKPEAAAPEAAL